MLKPLITKKSLTFQHFLKFLINIKNNGTSIDFSHFLRGINILTPSTTKTNFYFFYF